MALGVVVPILEDGYNIWEIQKEGPFLSLFIRISINFYLFHARFDFFFFVGLLS